MMIARPWDQERKRQCTLAAIKPWDRMGCLAAREDVSHIGASGMCHDVVFPNQTSALSPLQVILSSELQWYLLQGSDCSEGAVSTTSLC